MICGWYGLAIDHSFNHLCAFVVVYYFDSDIFFFWFIRCAFNNVDVISFTLGYDEFFKRVSASIGQSQYNVVFFKTNNGGLNSRLCSGYDYFSFWLKW